MNLLCTILFASLLLLFGCSGRNGFDSKKRGVKAGTNKKQVEESLGRPSVVYNTFKLLGHLGRLRVDGIMMQPQDRSYLI